MIFEIPEVIPVKTDGNVRALVTVRLLGVSLTHCRLIELPSGEMCLYGPQMRFYDPIRNCRQYKTLASWSDDLARRMGAAALRALRSHCEWGGAL